MRAPARVYRCEPPTGPPELAPLARAIRRHQARLHVTPLEQVLAMTPAEYAQSLLACSTGPEPEDADAPLSPEEQALVDAQGARIDRESHHA